MTEVTFGAEQALAGINGITAEVTAGNILAFEKLPEDERRRQSRRIERKLYVHLRRHGARVEHSFRVADNTRGNTGRQYVLPNGQQVSGFGRHLWPGTCMMMPREIND